MFRNTLLRNTTHTSQAPFDADDGQRTSPSCSRLRLALTGDVKIGPKLITGRGADCYTRVQATEHIVSVVMLNSFFTPHSHLLLTIILDVLLEIIDVLLYCLKVEFLLSSKNIKKSLP